MSDLKAKAYALAEATPPHLGQPTMPPIKWRQEGDELVVILADGRKIRGPLTNYPSQPGRKLEPKQPAPVSKPAAPAEGAGTFSHAPSALPRPAQKPRAR